MSTCIVRVMTVVKMVESYREDKDIFSAILGREPMVVVWRCKGKLSSVSVERRAESIEHRLESNFF